MKTQAELLKAFYSQGSSRNLKPVDLALWLNWINTNQRGQ